MPGKHPGTRLDLHAVPIPVCFLVLHVALRQMTQQSQRTGCPKQHPFKAPIGVTNLMTRAKANGSGACHFLVTHIDVLITRLVLVL